jgi:hypothetical protein
MQVKTTGEHVPPCVELRNQYGIPEIDVLRAGFDGLRGAHDRDVRIVRFVAWNPIAVFRFSIRPRHVTSPPDSLARRLKETWRNPLVGSSFMSPV